MASTADIIKRFSTPHHFHRHASLPASTKSLLRHSQPITTPNTHPQTIPQSSPSETTTSYVDMTSPLEEIPRKSPDDVARGSPGNSPLNGRSLLSARRRYPVSWREVESLLNESSIYHPANIPMRIVHDYSPPLNKQLLHVTKGLVVNAMYKTRNWVYVKTPDSRDGFVPFLCVEPVSISLFQMSEVCEEEESDCESHCHGYVSGEDTISHNKMKEKYPQYCQDSNYICMDRISPCNSKQSQDASVSHDTAYGSHDTLHQFNINRTSVSSSCDEVDEEHYLTVLFDYSSQNIVVNQQEVVKLLNDKNPDWVWVRKNTNEEGFIPKSYTVDLTLLNLDPSTKTTYL